mgnify:CR=1 FL=1
MTPEDQARLVRIEAKLDKFSESITRHDGAIRLLQGSAKVFLLALVSLAIGFINKLY